MRLKDLKEFIKTFLDFLFLIIALPILEFTSHLDEEGNLRFEDKKNERGLLVLLILLVLFIVWFIIPVFFLPTRVQCFYQMQGRDSDVFLFGRINIVNNVTRLRIRDREFSFGIEDKMVEYKGVKVITSTRYAIFPLAQAIECRSYIDFFGLMVSEYVWYTGLFCIWLIVFTDFVLYAWDKYVRNKIRCFNTC